MTGVTAKDVLAFWFEDAGPEKWYKKDDAFDATIKARFEPMLIETARAIEEDGAGPWEGDPAGDLATVITLDQFPRNIYRGTPEVYAFDKLAIEAAERAIAAGRDLEMPQGPRPFFYLPFMHAENLELQERCVKYMKERGGAPDNVKFAEHHCGIVRRFGRFPHRNEVLGRESSAEELAFLEEDGFRG